MILSPAGWNAELRSVTGGATDERGAGDPASGGGKYIFYNVGPLAGSGKLDVIAIGQTQEDAERALEEELPALLGLAG